MNGEPIGRWLQFGQLVAGVLIFTAGAVQYAFSHPSAPFSGLRIVRAGSACGTSSGWDLPIGGTPVSTR